MNEWEKVKAAFTACGQHNSCTTCAIPRDTCFSFTRLFVTIDSLEIGEFVDPSNY